MVFIFLSPGSNVIIAIKRLVQPEKIRTSSPPRSYRPQDSAPTSRPGSTTSWGRRRQSPGMSTSESCSLGTNRSRSSRGWRPGENIYHAMWTCFLIKPFLDTWTRARWWTTSPTEPEPCLPSRSRMAWMFASLACTCRWVLIVCRNKTSFSLINI